MERLGDNKDVKTKTQEANYYILLLTERMSYNKYLFILILKVYLETNLSIVHREPILYM